MHDAAVPLDRPTMASSSNRQGVMELGDIAVRDQQSHDVPPRPVASDRSDDRYGDLDSRSTRASLQDVDNPLLDRPAMLAIPLRPEPVTQLALASPQTTVILLRLVDPPRAQAVLPRSPSSVGVASSVLVVAVQPVASAGLPARSVSVRASVGRESPAVSTAAAQVEASDSIDAPPSPTAASPAVVGQPRSDHPVPRTADGQSPHLASDSAEGGLIDIGKPRSAGVAAPPALAENRTKHGDDVDNSGDVAAARQFSDTDIWAGDLGPIVLDDRPGTIADDTDQAAANSRWAVDPAEGGWIALAMPVLPADAALPAGEWPLPGISPGRRTPSLLADKEAIPIDVALGLYQAFELADEPANWASQSPPSRSPATQTGLPDGRRAASGGRATASLAAVVRSGSHRWQLAGALSGALGAVLIGSARREYASAQQSAARERIARTANQSAAD